MCLIIRDFRQAPDALAEHHYHHSGIELLSKKELSEGFIENVNAAASVAEKWQRYVRECKEADLDALITQDDLKPEESRKFLESALQGGELKTFREGIQKILPPTNPFDKSSRERKKGIIERLKAFFEKYTGLADADRNRFENTINLA